MKNKLIVSSSPHILSPFKTNHLMLDVIIALIPALIASVILFGYRPLLLVAVTIISCVLAEYISRKVMKRSNTISDLSAVVTGMLLAFNYPADFPIWKAIVGAVIAIIIVKQLFGGIGFNLVNPALAARAVFVVIFSLPLAGMLNPIVDLGFDVVSGATPLMLAAEGNYESIPSYLQLFLGLRAGSLGETSKVALLVGGIYLMVKRVISPIIPVTYIGVVFVLTALLGQNPLFHILSGGLFLGAFFMATDYATSPLTKKGKVIFAIGLGTITVAIRQFGVFYEGVAFAIITMNLLVPLIDNLTMPKAFGVQEEGVRNGV